MVSSKEQIKELNEILEPKGFIVIDKNILSDLYQKALTLEHRLSNIENPENSISGRRYKKEESKDLTAIIRNMIEGK